MIDVLIVDDEYMIRDGLKTLINWNNLGYKVIGTAENGKNALEVYKKAHPRVILADIKMPFMDGLELFSNIKKTDHEIYFIILTGYDDFDYARRSIELGVFSYLLKPVEPNELINVLIKIKKDIDKKEQSIIKLNALINKTTDSHFIEIQYLISQVVQRTGQVNNDILQKYHFNNMYFTVTLIDFNKNEILMIPNILALINNKNYLNKIFWVKYIHNSFLFIAISKNQSDSGKLMASFLHEISKLNQLSQIKNIGSTYLGLEGLIKSCNTALLKFNKAVLHKELLQHFDEIIINKSYYENTLEEQKNIITGILKKDRTEFLNAKSILFQELKKCPYKNIVVWILSRIMFQLLSKAKASGANYIEIFNNPLIISKFLFNYKDINMILAINNNTMDKIYDYFLLKKNGESSEIIKKSVDYIKNNIHDSTLSLKTVANYVGLSPSYFSTLFKKEKGIKFIEFLINTRVQAAIKLLISKKYSANEISYMVGYSNYNCFSTIFKKYTGLLPSQFNK